jgi:5,10-methylenetetrahydromethanopterin reductase
MERLGVGFSSGLQPKEVVECVKYAETLGYESAWMAEAHAGDQFSILTACAMATSRIKLGTSISSVFVRSAPTIAMAAATVDELSGGRFILGLGSSHKVQVVGEHGLVYSKPLSRVRETIEVVRKIWRDVDMSYHGELIEIEGFNLWFEPLRHEIPIYLGAVNPKMLRFTGAVGQGVILTRSTLEQTRRAVAHVVQGAKDAERQPEDIEMATQLSCSISNDKEAARNPVRDRVAMYAARFPRYRKVMEDAGYGDALEAVSQAWLAGERDKARRLVPAGLLDEMSLIGTQDEVRARIQAYREAGITLPIISPSVEREGGVEQAMATICACAPQS